jgi:hypothetical protein
MQLIRCPECQGQLKVPDELVEKPVKCPRCAKIFTATFEPPVPVAEEVVHPGASSAGIDESYDAYSEDRSENRRRRRRIRRDLEPHRGALILVLGILSFVIFGLSLILGPLAWILGSADLRAMREGRMDPEGESLTSAGRICGMISTILGVVSLFCCAGYFLMWIGLAAGGRFKGF